MGFVKTFGNGKYDYNFCKYVADTIEDAKKIRVRPINVGSEVYIIAEKHDYVLGSDALWHEMNGDGSFGCNCDHEGWVSESTVWSEIGDPE